MMNLDGVRAADPVVTKKKAEAPAESPAVFESADADLKMITPDGWSTKQKPTNG